MINEAIQLEDGDLAVEIWPLGARLNGVWFQGSGNLVLGSGNREEALTDKKYNGAVVGPVANRIAGGTAEIEGVVCEFEKNESERTTLHSGSTGVHARDWKVGYRDEAHLILTLDLEDGEGGFPGKRGLVADYRLRDHSLIVSFEAGTNAPTWINLALHPYWSLGETRDALSLQVTADRYTPVDDLKIPTGELASVTGTIFDIRKPQNPSSDIDHNFILSGSQPAVTLSSKRLRLDIETDAPGIQIYTGKEGGIAIEPQHFPDAMHHAAFPSIELRPGETYRQISTYRFVAL